MNYKQFLRKPIEIAIVGIPGSGKRIMKKYLKEGLGSCGVISSVHYTSSPKVIKTLGDFFYRIALKGEEAKNKKLTALGFGLTTTIYRIARFILGNEYDTVLIERHPSVDCLAYSDFYGINKNLVHALSKIMFGSTPNIVVYCDCNPDAAYKRRLEGFLRRSKTPKKQLHLHENVEDFNEIKKSYKGLLQHFSSVHGAQCVNVNIDESKDEMFEKINEHLFKLGINLNF